MTSPPAAAVLELGLVEARDGDDNDLLCTRCSSDRDKESCTSSRLPTRPPGALSGREPEQADRPAEVAEIPGGETEGEEESDEEEEEQQQETEAEEGQGRKRDREGRRRVRRRAMRKNQRRNPRSKRNQRTSLRWKRSPRRRNRRRSPRKKGEPKIVELRANRIYLFKFVIFDERSSELSERYFR